MRPDRSGEQIYFSKNKNVPSPGFEPRPAGGNASILINARENRATPGHVRDDTVPHSDPLRRHKSAHRGRQGITFCITPVPSDHLSDLPPSDDNDSPTREPGHYVLRYSGALRPRQTTTTCPQGAREFYVLQGNILPTSSNKQTCFLTCRRKRANKS